MKIKRSIEVLQGGLVTATNAAIYLGISQQRLANFRYKGEGEGPDYLEMKKRYYYKIETLDQWQDRPKKIDTIDVEIHVNILPDGRFTAQDAALYLGTAEKTMAMMRCAGTGPRFIKRGKIFYFKEDLDVWIEGGGKI